ncbi:histidine kinase [Sphingomonas changnyeongensis]|uniref:histidine kinase n=1 Tax=Sphingomonas changnyeongensis TaxID=2698679 RepID=A0A7Z2S7H0_9SPHN|nr:sensor histidine kinase [Sphingomonas changnyeongensis]QHL89607.1 histidine kinase [Sphingomonas changnyeongensis]
MIGRRFARLATGTRLLVLLSLALLPLGCLAVYAAIQNSRSVDLERRALLRIAADSAARRLAAEITVDVTALRAAVNLLDRGADELAVCARTRSVFGTALLESNNFLLVTRGGRPICGSLALARAEAMLGRPMNGVRIAGHAIEIHARSDTGAFIGIARYGLADLRRTVTPQERLWPLSAVLTAGDDRLALISEFTLPVVERLERVTVRVPRTGLDLIFAVERAPFTATQMITMLTPVMMWVAALAVAWLVIHRFVLDPLARLHATISAYEPGRILPSPARMTVPAREIADLGDTFSAISQTVAAHEAQLALGLTRQTRLTREVHHRVKNNLQVVSSLINLHARAARDEEAIAAYTTIGRRVDALAVVHRNHFAELEDNRGLNLHGLIGELTSNLRSTAMTGSTIQALPAIRIGVPSLFVAQDTAIPLAFLLTELIELAMTIDPAASIDIEIAALDTPGRARLTLVSPALVDGELIAQLLAERYGRVLEGLSRQLRTPLQRDGETGRFAVDFALLQPVAAPVAPPLRG